MKQQEFKEDFENVKRFTFRMSEDLFRELVKYAQRKETSLNRVAHKALEEFLERRKEKS